MTEIATTVVWLGVVLVVLWRWPALTVGLSGALMLWTVAPWATWASLAAIGAAAAAWRILGHGERLTWRGMGWLLHRPPLAAMVTSAGAATLGPEPVQPWAFLVLVASALWAARAWPKATEPTFLPVPAVGITQRPARLATAPCPDCGGTLTVSIRGHGDVAETIARTACPECGTRLVGTIDLARPDAGIVWFTMPTGQAG